MTSLEVPLAGSDMARFAKWREWRQDAAMINRPSQESE
jgi:hypothetical protein